MQIAIVRKTWKLDWENKNIDKPKKEQQVPSIKIKFDL